MCWENSTIVELAVLTLFVGVFTNSLDDGTVVRRLTIVSGETSRKQTNGDSDTKQTERQTRVRERQTDKTWDKQVGTQANR